MENVLYYIWLCVLIVIVLPFIVAICYKLFEVMNLESLFVASFGVKLFDKYINWIGRIFKI